jgi:hypothetical protein
MATTFIKIASVTVGSGGASTIDFTSIPATYTDLCLKLSLRTTFAGVFDTGFVSINNTNTGSYRGLYGTGAAAGSESIASLRGLYITGATATGSTFSSNDVYLPNYTSANLKSVSADSVTENNATTAIALLSGMLNGSTSTINQLTISSGNAVNLVQYSTATLYGIKNS